MVMVEVVVMDEHGGGSGDDNFGCDVQCAKGVTKGVGLEIL